MGNIARKPRGLLNFLQTQSGGENPDQLLESVRPTLDMFPFYAPDRLRASTQAINQAVAGFTGVTVPDGKAWLILALSVDITSITVSAHFAKISWHLERVPGQGVNGILLAENFYQQPATAAGSTIGLVNRFDTPIMASAGQVIAFRNDSSTANIVGQLELLYWEMDV